jgi:hypothetical protein
MVGRRRDGIADRLRLGVEAFGISIIEMGPNVDEYPEHDHSPQGAGGQMFAKRPEQLGQEEVYVACAGPAPSRPTARSFLSTLTTSSASVRRFGRKILAGPYGLRLLAIGGTPGQPPDSGGTL